MTECDSDNIVGLKLLTRCTGISLLIKLLEDVIVIHFCPSSITSLSIQKTRLILHMIQKPVCDLFLTRSGEIFAAPQFLSRMDSSYSHRRRVPRCRQCRACSSSLGGCPLPSPAFKPLAPPFSLLHQAARFYPPNLCPKLAGTGLQSPASLTMFTSNPLHPLPCSRWRSCCDGHGVQVRSSPSHRCLLPIFSRLNTSASRGRRRSASPSRNKRVSPPRARYV
jgi:hypothetical protein